MSEVVWACCDEVATVEAERATRCLDWRAMGARRSMLG